MATLAKELQPLKAPPPITVAQSGMDTLAKSQPWRANKFSHRSHGVEKMVTLDELQSSRAPGPPPNVGNLPEVSLRTLKNWLANLQRHPPPSPQRVRCFPGNIDRDPCETRIEDPCTSDGELISGGDLSIHSARWSEICEALLKVNHFCITFVASEP